MTAPLTHPWWCAGPPLCSADLDPHVYELLHRGTPVVVDDRDGTPLYVVLAQAPAAAPFIDLARLEAPVAAPFWAQAPLRGLSLSINDAAILARALVAFIRQATDPRTDDGRTDR